MPADVSRAVGDRAVDTAQDEVVAAVLASRRYRWLAPTFVARVAHDAARHTRRPAETIKEVKRRLHQVFGAYVDDLRVNEVVSALEAARGDGDAALREAAQRLMGQHASTRERIAILDRFYREVFSVTGKPKTVLDLACGLAPLAIPWMDLPSHCDYHAFDVDRRLVEIARAALAAFDVGGSAELQDVVSAPPSMRADVALVLKAVPCLEQQAPGSAQRLLDAIDAPWLVVSYPTRSLGGSQKGMVSHYRGVMERLCAGRDWRTHELVLPVELVYVVETGR